MGSGSTKRLIGQLQAGVDGLQTEMSTLTGADGLAEAVVSLFAEVARLREAVGSVETKLKRVEHDTSADPKSAEPKMRAPILPQQLTDPPQLAVPAPSMCARCFSHIGLFRGEPLKCIFPKGKSVCNHCAEMHHPCEEIPRRYWSPAATQIRWIEDVFWKWTHTKKLLKKYRKRKRAVASGLTIARYEDKKLAKTEAGSRGDRLDQLIDLLRFQAQMACSNHGLPWVWPVELLEKSARNRRLIPTPWDMPSFIDPEKERRALEASLDEPESSSTAAARGPRNAPVDNTGVLAGHGDVVDEQFGEDIDNVIETSGKLDRIATSRLWVCWFAGLRVCGFA
ncbi:hypothetical protein MMC07_006491 [Pseudocyphellaria aurata]|nr:hypothetical protein [Pseudocyphellaria aurata]